MLFYERNPRETSSAQESESPKGIFYLHPAQICARETPKTRPKRNDLIRCAKEIRQYGLQKPLLLRAEGEGTAFLRYFLAEAPLRWQAACLAELERIPCILEEKTPESCEKGRILAQIRENRLNMFELAAAYRLLMSRYGMTQGEIALACGVSQPSIANKLRLLRFSTDEKQEILTANLSERHARALLRAPESARRALLGEVISRHLTVAKTELLIDKLLCGEVIKTEENCPKNAPNPPKKPLFTPKSGGFEQNQPQSDASGGAGNHTPKAHFKLALQDLGPLYTSLDRPLAFMRRSGWQTEMRHEESAEGILIQIALKRP